MSFSSLASLPVLADLLLAPTTFRTSLSKPYRLAPFNVGKFRSWLNSVHSVFELRNVSRREILVKFHNLNIRFLSHPKNLRRECPCSGSNDTYLRSCSILITTPFSISLTTKSPPTILSENLLRDSVKPLSNASERIRSHIFRGIVLS